MVGSVIGILRVSSTNKTDRHSITELLLKVGLNTIKQTNKQIMLLGIMKERKLMISEFGIT
jgi:hypothetical protein